MAMIFGNLRQTLRRRRAYNAAFGQSYRELSALGQRELNELGIGQGDIGRLAREEAERWAASRL